jgi:hypothetical protein
MDNGVDADVRFTELEGHVLDIMSDSNLAISMEKKDMIIGTYLRRFVDAQDNNTRVPTAFGTLDSQIDLSLWRQSIVNCLTSIINTLLSSDEFAKKERNIHVLLDHIDLLFGDQSSIITTLILPEKGLIYNARFIGLLIDLYRNPGKRRLDLVNVLLYWKVRIGYIGPGNSNILDMKSLSTIQSLELNFQPDFEYFIKLDAFNTSDFLSDFTFEGTVIYKEI